MTASEAIAARPRARGWIHLVAFLVSPALVVSLIALAAVESGTAALATSVYCASMMATFGVSALYHRRRWSERGWNLMRRLDHATIFLFIAGTYTPFGLLALSGAARWWVLGVVWAGCAAGVILKIANPHGARWMALPIYLAVGWAAVFVIADITAAAGLAAVTLLIVGGALYTVGGVAYALRWPNPSPRVFGFHEIFHLLTVAAALCQYIAIFMTVYAA